VRESAANKANRYLRERRLTVDVVSPTLIAATCRSDGIVHECGWTPQLGWACSCPGFRFGRRCAHVIALMAVTVREGPA
jgi:hypothetical protein